MRVETLSLWRRANFQVRRRTLCGDRACRNALALAPCEFSRSPANLLRGWCVLKRSCRAMRIFNVWRVKHPEDFVWNRQASRCLGAWQRWRCDLCLERVESARCFGHVGAVASGASSKFRLEWVTFWRFSAAGSAGVECPETSV